MQLGIGRYVTSSNLIELISKASLCLSTVSDTLNNSSPMQRNYYYNAAVRFFLDFGLFQSSKRITHRG